MNTMRRAHPIHMNTMRRAEHLLLGAMNAMFPLAVKGKFTKFSIYIFILI